MARKNVWGEPDESGYSPKEAELIKLWEETDLEKREIAEKLGVTERAAVNKYHTLKKRAIKGGLNWPTKNIPKIGTLRTERTTKKVEGNYLYVKVTHTRIKNEEDLIREAQIDMKTWKCVDWEATVWEMGAKVVDRDLRYKDGKATGTIKSQGLTVTDLWRVNAKFIRREPIEITPVIKPVVVNFKLPPALSKTELAYPRKALIGSDPQFGFYRSLRTGQLTPFHDRKALDVMLQVAQDYDFTHIVFLGDWLDLADWTDKFIRSPNMYWTTQPAAIESKWWLTQFVSTNPQAETSIIEGNHDKRINDSIMKHLKEAFEIKSVDALELPPLLSVPRILALHDIDVKWVGPYPDGQVWITDHLACEHGDKVRAGSGATAAALIKDAHYSIVFGHIHRVEAAFKTIHNRGGITLIQVWSIGCLCRNDGAVPAGKKRQNWQQAFAVVDYFEDSFFQLTPVVIEGGRAIYNGKVYEARDRLPDLVEATTGTKAEWNW